MTTPHGPGRTTPHGPGRTTPHGPGRTAPHGPGRTAPDGSGRTAPRTSGRPRQEPIAIIGLSALMPGSAGMGGFWRTVVEGDDLITDVPPGHWLVSDYYDPDPAAPDKTYGHRGSFLDPVDFDPLAFGLPPSALPATDTAQTLTLIAAQRLLDDVERCSPAGYDRDRAGVILGAGPLELLTTMANRMQRPVWTKAMRAAGLPESQVQSICDRIAEHYVPWQEATLPGLLSNVLAGRVANRFDLHGTNFVTDAACAGSLAALSAAVNELSLRQADMVVTGGVDTLNDAVWYTSFSKTPALSPTGDCRPFSAGSDGMVLGEGIVLFALKRLADAERDGDAIYAVIRGVGTSSDGHGTAVYAPLPAGQVRSLRRAYRAAGYGPATVELMEAHGTGTPAGDAAEVAALREVFGEAATSSGASSGASSGTPPAAWCALGSIKSQFGHTKSTAGAAGLLKAVLALHHKVLPPTIKVERPNPRLGLTDGPFHLNTVTRPWIRDSAHPRRASVSSFGFGGTNFHVTAEEYTADDGGRSPDRLSTAPSELVVLAAPSSDALLHRCRTVLADDRPFPSIARETQREYDAAQDGQRPSDDRARPENGTTARASQPARASRSRLAVVAADADELRRKVEQAAARIQADPRSSFSTPDGVHYGCGDPADQRVAFLFPGQGSQYVGMGADLAMHMPEARQVWDRLADVHLGDAPLHRVVFPAPAFTDDERDAQAALLTATEWAQPAVATYGMAMLALLRTLGLRPACAAGHSLGELTALHAAGALDAETLLGLTRRRGELMRDAARVPGGMLAVQASARDVEGAIRATGLADLWPANHNSPDQTVVAGGSRSIDVLRRHLDGQGVRARSLAVSTAFHSPLVQNAARPLLDHVRGLSVAPLTLPVYGNRDAAPYPRDCDAGDLAKRLAGQLISPVLFADQVAAIYDSGIRTFVEVGPGSTLTGLVRANLRGREHSAISLDRLGKNGVTALYDGLAALIARGVPLSLAALRRNVAPPAAPEPPRSPATVRISGTNYGKAYPPAGGVDDLPPPNPEPDVGSRLGLDDPNTSEVTTAMAQPSKQASEQSPNGRADWLQTLREIHRLAAETHASYQRSTADAHLAYLAAVDRSLGNGNSVTTERRSSAPDDTGTPAPTAEEMAPAPMEPPPMAPAPDAFTSYTFTPEPTAPEPTHVEPAGFEPASSEPTRSESVRSEPTRAEPIAADHAPETGASSEAAADLTELTLQIVADKTGYPAEILRPEMHLQADLGVDSIKRVEVLSALRDRIEGLPTLDAAELGRLQTIGEIADRLVSEVRG
ncbi:beta-ketoacyl synthase N-terminal-like domain-containing protein [Spirillospora sp. NPDC048911]|uniref:beta-ketoacyl synthase N-terminal-like domain-containing protein n=1 Tax=Spirillospora sp. NPDC048911 TaxID=3364527 RepID=UPI00371DDC51